jgi:hypothetical protein
MFLFHKKLLNHHLSLGRRHFSREKPWSPI